MHKTPHDLFTDYGMTTCHCDPAFSERGMADPNCVYCSFEIEDLIAELGNMIGDYQASEFRVGYQAGVASMNARLAGG